MITALQKNIAELSNLGWSNVKIAETLSSADSYGNEFTYDEILEMATTHIRKINGEIREHNERGATV
jgi:hypothetical protein